MKHIECGCGQEIILVSDFYKPFIKCPNCGRRLPVHGRKTKFMKRCPKCGRYLEKDEYAVHCRYCSGVRSVFD